MDPALRLRYIALLSLAALGLGLPSPGLAAADDAGEASLPRYRFAPGQEITYKGENTFKYGEGSSARSYSFKNDWKAWVARKNDDGSHRLVVLTTETMQQDGRDAGSPDTTLAYFDISDDGRIIPNDTFGYRFDPTVLFPKLPADRKQAAEGWEDSDGQADNRHHLTVQSPPRDGSAGWVIVDDRTSPMDEIYLATHKAAITFDPSRGLVAKSESENTQGYGINGKGTGITELVSVEDHGADWAKTFATEADRYFAGIDAYKAQFQKASKSPAGDDGPFAQAEKILSDLREQVGQSPFKERIDEQLRDYKRSVESNAQEAKHKAKVVGQPAAEWEVEDLGGKSHALKDYRGKVVVLDFWYRGCGWCIKAMPQMKQLAEDFRDRPVAILGMNTDSKQEDAEFVVEKMGLNYPNLKATGIPEKYGIQGFPTLVIIDQEGKVHDLHVGYSKTLRKEVAEEIEGLLKEK